MMHTKSIVIDDQWNLFGSPNFDNRSFELNDEILVAAYDVQLVGKLNANFETDIRQAKRIVLDETDVVYPR